MEKVALRLIIEKKRGTLREAWLCMHCNRSALVWCGLMYRRRTGWKDKLVPLVLHGGGVAFTHKKNSLMVWSMSFLLARGVVEGDHVSDGRVLQGEQSAQVGRGH